MSELETRMSPLESSWGTEKIFWIDFCSMNSNRPTFPLKLLTYIHTGSDGFFITQRYIRFFVPLEPQTRLTPEFILLIRTSSTRHVLFFSPRMPPLDGLGIKCSSLECVSDSSTLPSPKEYLIWRAGKKQQRRDGSACNSSPERRECLDLVWHKIKVN